jgi:hypothetical protein
MGQASIVNLTDTRPKPRWSLPRTAIAHALDRQPSDPVLMAVHGEVLAALKRFRSIEHWRDRVTVETRVRALSVIRRALDSAQKQYSHL